jgi:hypothetical protein
LSTPSYFILKKEKKLPCTVSHIFVITSSATYFQLKYAILNTFSIGIDLPKGPENITPLSNELGGILQLSRNTDFLLALFKPTISQEQ